MPGILPMKVIKVGNSAQSRVAQACDRCRSKKIRCDGIRPCCSQCANVGFECRTSDKLSRRAFPRGYTESLEERVRALEADVRDLRALVDEKDARIDLLSRLPPASTAAAALPRPLPAHDSPRPPPPAPDDLVAVQYAAPLRRPAPNAPFMGPSSTRAFVDAFGSRLERSGRPSVHAAIDAALAPAAWHLWAAPDHGKPKMPPRLVCDQLLNIFFQEWAPLYPVIHRPTVLKAYTRCATATDPLEHVDPHLLAQLNLIFGIAAISSTQARLPQDPVYFERNWTPQLEALVDDISLSTLQCYVLAQIYYSIKSDYKNLLRYRSLAVSICLQLGLHQSQARFLFNPLVSETRKRVFWCQYSLDRFTAALTGLPVLMAESDICTEYPADIDDEHMTDPNFVPNPSTDATDMSSALALFSVSHILGKVLDELYASPAGCEISLSTMHALAEELDDWLKKLPPHLRLEFVQDKPSPAPTNSRSPILSIIYYFIRTLIRRPVACYGKPENASPSMLSLVDSAKHTIQLLKLLDERRLSLSVTINRRELIFLSGLGLLWQSMDLSPDSKLVKESQRLLNVAATLLESETGDAAATFTTVVETLSPGMLQRRLSSENLTSTTGSPSCSPKQRTPSKQMIQPYDSRLSFSSESDLSTYSKGSSRLNFMAASPELSRSVRSSSSNSGCSDPAVGVHATEHAAAADGLDNCLPLGDEKKLACAAPFGETTAGMSDWEHVLSNMDSGHANIYNGIYGGSECGETPAAFAALAPAYHPQHQQQQQQQQRPPPASMPPCSSPSAVMAGVPAPHHAWPHGSWPPSAPAAAAGGGGGGGAGSSGPMAGKASEAAAVPTSMGHPYEAMMIGHHHQLDGLDVAGADLAMTDPWMRQCAM
ncbi:DNA-binding transcription factor cat8 [Ophidiomyces ophidiicola]|nr:DNA-binding transcription factor cat8 [Ophidiomyces ophidiicola]KAI2040972.1 DNA-binding transcription factor cat8 [Ophidiomyces ophidiicola]KAI2112740.1 DNA-binding transcription factor cat8 [Ophidiomyces ophidiicola]KAI2243551.1 DNA-binding transcription factor cat8 [Ophidiomyces ophidiicola]KAI2275725.1 DNA-binding transcription factor cat8 [Ophidiomyces ophidiicola]